MASLTVAECMSHQVFAVVPDTSIEVTARLFTGKHFSGAPVIDEDCHAVGVITLNDISDPDRARGAEPGSATVFRLIAGGRQKLDGGRVASPGRVGDIMTSFVVSVPPDTAVREAMRLMVSDGIHRLFVHDADKRLVGIVTSMDILRALLT